MFEHFVPDLSSRPFSMTVEREMKGAATLIYDAWTRRFDSWFAQPGELIMTPEVGSLFFFYNRHDWGRHAHYGRFLELQEDRRVKMTWLTGAPGTYGDETVIEVELEPRGEGTLLRLRHSGFSTEAACKAHEDNWPAALEVLDDALRPSSVRYTKLGYIEESELTQFLSQQYGVPSVKLHEFEIDPAVIALVPEALARQHLVIPVNKAGASVIVAMADPSNILGIEALRSHTGYNIEVLIAAKQDVEDAIQRYYGPHATGGG